MPSWTARRLSPSRPRAQATRSAPTVSRRGRRETTGGTETRIPVTSNRSVTTQARRPGEGVQALPGDAKTRTVDALRLWVGAPGGACGRPTLRGAPAPPPDRRPGALDGPRP